MNNDSVRVTKFRGASLVLLMVLSTVAGPMAQSQEPEATVEFATSGDFLLLDATERVVIGVDIETLLSSNNLNDAISSVSSLDGAHNGVLTGIAHTEMNLYLTYSDGVIEEYENHGGGEGFAHWVRSEVDTLNPPATSVDIHNGFLYWTSEGDSTVYIVRASLLGYNHTPLERVIDDPAYAGGLSGIVVSDDLEGPDHAPVISVLDDSGSTVLVTDQELSYEASVVGERLWARDGEPVRAIEEVKVNQSGTEQTVLIALDGDSLRILEREETSSQLHIFSASVTSEEANYSSQNYASTGVANNELREYTVLQFSNTQLNSNNRCFPLRITFDELTPFTYEDRNITNTGGSITLSIGGVEKTVTHEEISNQTLLWGPENNDELIPDMCAQTSSTVDFTIVDWEPTNLVANVVLSEPETVPVFGDENSSYPTSWSRSDITWSKGPSSVATPRASDSVEVFGDHVFEEIAKINFDIEDEGTSGRGGLWLPIGLFTDSSYRDLGPAIFPNRPDRNEIVTLNSVTPVQSVWEPEYFTQDKDMWWEVNLSYQWEPPEYNPLGIRVHQRETITVELLTQGVECTKDKPKIQAASMIWGGCDTQYRMKDTWEYVPLYDNWLKSTTMTDQVKETVLGTYMDEVNVVRFELPLTIDSATNQGYAESIIPYSDWNPATNQAVNIQPAEPDPDGFDCIGKSCSPYIAETVTLNLPYLPLDHPANPLIETDRGVVKWKVVVDPDNELEEEPNEREDNSMGWNGHGSEGKELSILFGDTMNEHKIAPDGTNYLVEDDTYRILVIRTGVIFKECDNWKALGWNTCLDWDEQKLEPPSAEWAEGMIDFAEEKMQEMFPIPDDGLTQYSQEKEQRLQIDLRPGVLWHTRTEKETPPGFRYINQAILRTMQAFDVIDRGIAQANLLNYDRVVLLTHEDAADSGGDPDNDGWPESDWDDRIFGALEFDGICPCSKAVIVTRADLHQDDDPDLYYTFSQKVPGVPYMGYTVEEHHNPGAPGYSIDGPRHLLYMQKTAETLIHEIGHSMYVGHDNEGSIDRIFNNCGTPYIYDPDTRASGWSPVALPRNNLPHDNQQYFDAESFMRYASDGQVHDGGFTLEDYGYENSWIQNMDYEWMQTNYAFDVGEQYLTMYMASVIQNLFDEVKDMIVDGFNGYVSWWNSVLAAIWADLKESVEMVKGEFTGSSYMQDLNSGHTSSDNGIRFEGLSSPAGGFMAGTVLPSKITSTNSSMLDTAYTFVQLDRDGVTILETPVMEIAESRGLLNGVGLLVAAEVFDDRTVAWMIIDRDGYVMATDTIPLLASFNVTAAQSTPRGNNINLSWESVSNEGLTYDLTLISEGGSIEYILAKGWTDPWTELDTSDWDLGTYQLVVKASDGFREITEMSDEFSVTGIDHEISWISSSLAAPGEEVMMVIDYFDDTNSFARSTEMNCTYTADDWNVQVMDSLGNRVLLSMSVRNDASFADVRPQIVVDCAGHPPNYISHPVSMSVKGPNIDLDDVGDVFDNLDLDLDADLDLDKPDVEKAFFVDIDGDGIADLFDRCYPVTNLTQCEEMLLGSENGTNSTTDDGGTTGTTDNSQDDTRDSEASSQSLFENPGALILGFLAGGLMMAVVGPSLIGRKEEDDGE